jgi:NAD(P)-dependent dehydrogenase (short-subunit alcohol dehydrogenase family)
MDDFLGRVVLITGAGHGLGAAYARFLAARGAIVFINGISDACINVANEISMNGFVAKALVGDISNPYYCEEIINNIVENYGRIDVLINNAGNRPNISLAVKDMKDSDLSRIIKVHLNGSFNLSIAAWKFMEKQKYGRILNTSANIVLGNTYGLGFDLPHAVAKAAIIGLTKSLASEGKAHDIKINSVMPISLEVSRFGHHSDKDKNAIRDILKELEIDDDEAMRRIACGVASLVHENVPCSGDIFSICNNRISKIFFSETNGHRFDNISISEIHEEFKKIIDISDSSETDFHKNMTLGIGLRFDRFFH